MRPEFYRRKCPGKNRWYTYSEFIAFPEYSNILTKLFGEFGCPKAQACLAHMARSPETLRSLFKVDDVCGRLETRDVLLKKAAHDARCAHRGPGAQPRVADESIGGLFSRLRGA